MAPRQVCELERMEGEPARGKHITPGAMQGPLPNPAMGASHPPGQHPASCIQQPAALFVPSHAQCWHRCLPGQACLHPGSPGAGRAAGSQAPAASGDTSFPTARNHEQAGGWPCAWYLPPPLSHASVPNQSVISIHSGESFCDSVKVFLPLLPNAIVFPRRGSSGAAAQHLPAPVLLRHVRVRAPAQLLPAKSRADFILTAKCWAIVGKMGLEPPEGGSSQGLNPLSGAWRLVSAALSAWAGITWGC